MKLKREWDTNRREGKREEGKGYQKKRKRWEGKNRMIRNKIDVKTEAPQKVFKTRR